MTRIALATCARQPAPTPGLATLIDLLAAEGLAVDHAPWQAGAAPFAGADLVLPLAAWDYAETPQAFADWIAAVAAAGGRFGNPAGLMLWNLHKSYLCDLAQRGVAVVPTLALDRPEAAQIRAELAARGWAQAVLKPAIGQSGLGVTRIAAAGPMPPLPEVPVVLQPFLDQVTAGETSLVFVAGGFSHAVRRNPAAGDFRANTQFGASVQAVDPGAARITLATQALAALTAAPLYARVDLLNTPRGPVISEIELIEPALFLDHAAATMRRGLARRFAAAAARRPEA
ncbi:ATP-grasp domain-containing protein [Rhodobacter capsulatus]|uniref:ATP-grasp domain-containing protein n=1 Tax=Rhodobacter capsulatus TaxID=1061 RepID=UPI001142B9A9|nr:glutathione synthetase [Rhodobacter capsulatus]TQD32728.1 glutathione synthetase [Rhodobacter capsulatus]